MVERDLFRLALPNPRTLTLLSCCPRWQWTIAQSGGGRTIENPAARETPIIEIKPMASSRLPVSFLGGVEAGGGGGL